MVAYEIRNRAALLPTAQTDMNADQAVTLKLIAAMRFNAAERNMSPAHA